MTTTKATPAPEAEPTTASASASAHQLRILHALMRDFGITGDTSKHDYLSTALGRPISSASELTTVECARAIADLETSPVPAMGATGIYAALAQVMADVDHVAKGDRNTQQGFSFRGVDAVVNAVGPALRKRKVTVVPDLQRVDYVAMPLTSGKSATVCRVVVAYRFTALDGSSITATVAAEAFDMGDKATPKAMSVAFRTALLQALALPTDEPDPDSMVYETATAPPPSPPQRPSDDLDDMNTAALLMVVDQLATTAGATFEDFTARFRAEQGGMAVSSLDDVAPERLRPWIRQVRAYMARKATA